MGWWRRGRGGLGLGGVGVVEVGGVKGVEGARRAPKAMRGGTTCEVEGVSSTTGGGGGGGGGERVQTSVRPSPHLVAMRNSAGASAPICTPGGEGRGQWLRVQSRLGEEHGRGGGGGRKGCGTGGGGQVDGEDGEGKQAQRRRCWWWWPGGGPKRGRGRRPGRAPPAACGSRAAAPTPLALADPQGPHEG